MKKMQIRMQLVCLFSMLLLFFPVELFAQQGTITGKVVDERGESVIGATVMVKGSTDGTITDLDGNFKINGKVGTTITVSYVGYAPLEVKITKLTGNRFVMKEDSKTLDEVVVVGMGTQKRNTITAAVATVNADAIATRPVTDVTSALQGNVAGLNFASDASESGTGGEVGGEIKFNIRGIGSINGGEPYVLVDGVEQSLQNVNPADIESISVLKDASAAAVYGARAAYGVVLVTTKSGKQDKARVTYRGSVGMSAPINMPEMMNSVEFANYKNAYRSAIGESPYFSQETIDLMNQFLQNPYGEGLPGITANQENTGWRGGESQYANTDWFDYFYKNKSLRHSHNLSISGGSDKVTYYVGLGYTYQGGLLDRVEDSLDKYNVNTKFQIKPNDWLKFNFNNNITLNLISRPLPDMSILYHQIARSQPNMVTEVPISGLYNLPSWNEALYLDNVGYSQNRISDAMTFAATVTPLKGWDIIGEMKVRFDVQNDEFLQKQPRTTRPDGTIENVTAPRQGYSYPGIEYSNSLWGSMTRGNQFNYYLSPSVSSSYTNQWGDHFFKAMAGFQMEVQQNSSMYAYKDGVMSDDTFSFDNANGKAYNSEARDHWATMGFYTRLNWNYQNVYFLEFSGRYDGSSRFASGNRWGFFPSFSAGYDIARTDYFKQWSLPVSQLKVRLSYGRLGNQNGAGLYDYLNFMTLRPDYSNAWLLSGVTSATLVRGTVALTPSMVSPYITWEKVDNANLGFDLTLLNNRLTITADIYQRTTKDMIGPAEAIPDIGGIAVDQRAKVNNATLRNRGWELSVNWSDQLKNGFSYGIGFNIFDYKAVVTKYNNPEGLIYNNHTGLVRNKGYYQGMDLGEIWGYEANDLFLTNQEVDEYLRGVDMSFFKPNKDWQRGDLKYIDSNGDGKIDPGSGTLKDHGDLKIIGNTTPRYSFGLNLHAGYKGFEVSALFQGVMKRDFPMAASTYLFSGDSNFFKEHLDYYNVYNPGAYLPRLTKPDSPEYNANVGYNTSRYLLNAAYMRLKNLMISYNFQPKLVKKMGLENLKVYFTCDNLFTIDNLPDVFDPETLNQVNTWAGGSNETAPGLTSPMKQNGNGKVYPLNKNYVFGIEFTF